VSERSRADGPLPGSTRLDAFTITAPGDRRAVCPDDPGWCLNDHIRPRLDGWTESPTVPGQYYARCPAHGGRKRSLSIRVGDRGRRIVWRCHAEPRCPDAAVRAALIRRDVPDGCLPRVPGQRTEDELAATIIAICASVPPGRPRELAILAAVYGVQHSRAALAVLGERFGIDRSTAYRVTDLSHDATDETDTRQILLSHDATACRTVRQTRDGFTCGFGESVTPGVDHSVGRDGHPRVSVFVTPPVSVTQCEVCGRGPVPRADARYCDSSCRQKAYRARRKARGESPLGGSVAARERGGVDDA
jgi:hypothetical protein